MNQLEAINYVFTGLLAKFSELSDYYGQMLEDLNEMVDDDDNHFNDKDYTYNFLVRIDENVKFLKQVCNAIESHLTQPASTTLIDFIKVCDELQKILPKPVDDSAENDIVRKENS